MHSMYIFSLLLIGLVSQCHGQQKQMEVCPTYGQPPKIIDRDTIYTYLTNVNRLQLECLAPYPIEWDVHGREMFTVVRQQITTNGDILTNPVRCFNSTLIVYQSESEHVVYSRTGNYTCRNIHDKSISSSIYKFIHDQHLFAYPAPSSDFYSERIEANHYLVIQNEEFIIPCRSNIETINASLVKIETPKLLKLHMNDYVRYDPKKGFLINASRFPFNPVGDYECELNYRNEKANALIHLLQYQNSSQPDYDVFPETENLPFNNIDKTFTLKCRSNEEIYLSASNPESFETFNKRSKNGSFIAYEFNPALQLQRQHVFKYEASVEITPKAMSSGQIFCKTAKNNSIFHTWNYNLWFSCDCSWNTSLSKGKLEDAAWESIWQNFFPDLKGSIQCKTKQYNGLVSFHPCHNPTECKNSVFCPSERRFCQSFNSFHDPNTIELHDTVYLKQLLSGVIECSVQGYGHRFHAYADLNKIVIGKSELQTYINITESEEFILKSDPQIFKCEVATYYLSGDLKWAFQFKNKTIRLIEKEVHQSTQEAVGHKLTSTIILKISDSEVESLYCFAPVWNTTKNEWKNSSVPISVEDPNSEEYKTENLFAREKCLEEKKSSDNSPLIIMERYTSTSTANFTTFWKATEKEFILRKRKLKKLISLICRAQYPIEWSFEGKRINTGFKLIENSMGNGGSNKTMCFESKITIYDTTSDRNARSTGLQGPTGKYVCQSNHDQALKSSTYIYRHYNTSFPLISHGHHVKLEIENEKRQNDLWTVFPCRVTHPKIDVHLYVYSNNQYTELTIGENVKYNPTKGFSVLNSLIDFSGHYICSTKIKDESHSISFSITDKPSQDIQPSRINQESSNSTKPKSRCKMNRNNKKSSLFFIVSITAAVLLVSLVVVILLLFREIINQKKVIRDLTNGLSVSYSQRLRESNPAFMEDIHIPETNRNVRPSSSTNYERF